MRVLISKTCSAGGQHLESGQTYDLSEDAAKELIKIDRASEAPEAPACPPTPPKPKQAKAVVPNVDS
jgi:hypothetical protein